MRLKAKAPFVLVFSSALAFASPVFSQQPVDIVVFGDSLVAGYELGPGEDYPAKLQQALVAEGYDVSIANAGVSGDTTSGGLARVDWSVPDGTDGVILELGANDALRGLPPEKTAENLSAIIRQLQARDIDVLLMGMMAPPNMGADYGEAFNAIYGELAVEYGVSLHPFFLDGVTTHPDLQLSDGMHPNARGVDVMVEKTLPVVEDFISTIRGQAN